MPFATTNDGIRLNYTVRGTATSVPPVLLTRASKHPLPLGNFWGE